MDRNEFLDRVTTCMYGNTGGSLRKRSREFSEIMVDVIKEGLIRDGRVFTDFGEFYIGKTGGRKAYNFRTGEHVDVPAGEKVKFKLSGKFQKILDKNGKEETEEE